MRTTFSLALLVALQAPLLAGAEPQTKKQQACLAKVQQGCSAVAGVTVDALVACAKRIAKGKALEACAKDFEKVAKARSRNAESIQKKCEAEPPGFGAAAASEVTEAAESAADSLFEGVFGPDFESFASQDKPTARCQAQVTGML